MSRAIVTNTSLPHYREMPSIPPYIVGQTVRDQHTYIRFITEGVYSWDLHVEHNITGKKEVLTVLKPATKQRVLSNIADVQSTFTP